MDAMYSNILSELKYDVDHANNICVVDRPTGMIMNVGPQRAVNKYEGVKIIKSVKDLNNPVLRKKFFKLNHKDDPFFDSYIRLELPHSDESKNFPMCKNSVIAGGKAVIELLKHLDSPIKPWDDTDVDLFILGQHKFTTISVNLNDKKMDVVMTPELSEAHLLHRFDLACSRVAIHDIDSSYFCVTVSVKCLQSLFNRKVHVPSYIRNTVTEARPDNKLANKIAQATLKRIEKYKNRGFIFVYHDIMRPLSFITKGYFTRAGFVIDTLNDNDKPVLFDKCIDRNAVSDAVSSYS